MELKYVKAESTVKPSELEIGKFKVYLRRNIVEDDRLDGVFWTYEEASLLPKEYEEYSKTHNDNNQMIIMEALADLYDAIASAAYGGGEV